MNQSSISTLPQKMSVVSRSNLQKKNKHGTHKISLSRAVFMLRQGGVVVLRTDTLYGLVGRADIPKVIDRVMRLKYRSAGKPFIVLLARKRDVKEFGVVARAHVRKAIIKYWPGPYTLIFDVPKERCAHIHQGNGSIAFRVPDNAKLRALLRKTGPLIAPSANPEGEPPAMTITEAQAYFGSKVDGYVDGGVVKSKRPSKIYKVSDSDLERLR